MSDNNKTTTRKEKNQDYLSNKEMFAEVIDCQEKGRISDRLGKMFLLLANKYSSKPNFSGYSYRDEMVSTGIVACCAAVNKFNPEKSQNPFAYFTQCIHTAFVQILNKERKHQEIRDKLLVEEDMNPSFGYIERHKDDFYDGEHLVSPTEKDDEEE